MMNPIGVTIRAHKFDGELRMGQRMADYLRLKNNDNISVNIGTLQEEMLIQVEDGLFETDIAISFEVIHRFGLVESLSVDIYRHEQVLILGPVLGVITEDYSDIGSLSDIRKYIPSSFRGLILWGAFQAGDFVCQGSLRADKWPTESKLKPKVFFRWLRGQFVNITFSDKRDGSILERQNMAGPSVLPLRSWPGNRKARPDLDDGRRLFAIAQRNQTSHWQEPTLLVHSKGEWCGYSRYLVRDRGWSELEAFKFTREIGHLVLDRALELSHSGFQGGDLIFELGITQSKSLALLNLSNQLPERIIDLFDVEPLLYLDILISPLRYGRYLDGLLERPHS